MQAGQVRKRAGEPVGGEVTDVENLRQSRVVT